MIYAIRAVGTEYIKFGVAKSVEQRIKAIQTSCPLEIELIANCWGGYTYEAAIHNRLVRAKAHVRGEWFKNCPEAQEIIKEMQTDSLRRTNQRTSVELVMANRKLRIPVVEVMERKQLLKKERLAVAAKAFPRARTGDMTDADIHAAVSTWFDQKHRSNASIMHVES